MFDLIEDVDKQCGVLDIIAYPCIIMVDLIGTDDVRYADVIDIIPCVIIMTVMNLFLLFFLILGRVCILYDTERKKNCCKDMNDDKDKCDRSKSPNRERKNNRSHVVLDLS